MNKKPAANRRLAQWRVMWLIEHSASHQHLWCIESFVFRNPPLRQAPNRYQQAEKKRTRPQYLTGDLSKTELTKL